MSDVLNVSYSKAQAFKACKFKFNLAHVEQHVDGTGPGLMPLKKAPALTRGSLGHFILEQFFNEIRKEQFPYNKEKCAQVIHRKLAEALLHDDAQYLGEIAKQIEYFAIERFPILGWKILEVEKELRLLVGTDSTGKKFVVPVTIDLIIETQRGIFFVDHKFAADAYKSPRIDIEPQLPVYVGVGRALGIKVVGAYYNFLRTRKMNNVADQVLQIEVTINNHRIKTSFNDHLDTMKEIEKWDGKVTRTPNNNCDYCDFAELCAVDMSGEDVTLMKQVKFKPNDYGYDEV